VKILEFIIYIPLKVMTICTMLHMAFLDVLVAKGMAMVSKDSRSSAILGLPLFCKEGEHMVTVTWVLRPDSYR